MIISTQKHVIYNKKKQTALQKLKRRYEADYLDQPTTSSTSFLENSFVLPQKSRSWKSDVSYEDDISHFDKRDSDHEPKPVRGKNYQKSLPFTINEKSCNLPDRRLTFIREQSDQLL